MWSTVSAALVALALAAAAGIPLGILLGAPPRAGRPDVSLMSARDALLPWRTARRNVELSLELRGMAAAARHERAARTDVEIPRDRAGQRRLYDRLLADLT